MSITAAKPAKKTATAADAAPPLFVGQSHQAPAGGEDDFVCDVVALLRSARSDLTDEQAARIDAALRERWGGDRPYIARRLGQGRSDRNEAIRRDHRRGVSIPVLCRRYEVSRVTVWRVVGVGE